MIDRAIRLKDYTTICNSGPGEFLMRAGLKAAQTLFARNRTLIADNEARVRAFASARADDYKWRAPAAGPVGLLEVLNGGATELCDQLRCEADVLAVPSALFDMPDKYVRVGLGRAGVRAAIDQWQAWETRQRR